MNGHLSEGFDSRAALAELLAAGKIDLRSGAVLERQPAAMPADFDFGERVDGMMLGLAIGDALGRPTEGRKPAQRRASHGEIRDYAIGRRAKEAIGMPSDDTQMAFWTLEQLAVDGGLIPEHLAARFCRGTIFGMGQTVSAFRRNFGKPGSKHRKPWYEAGPASAGNGALMRIAPILVPHLRAPSPALWSDAALAAMLTHNDSASTSACVAFVAMLWELLAMSTAPAERWWLERWLEVARDLETGTRYSPRGGDFVGAYEGPLSDFVAARVDEALTRGTDTVVACNSWYSGAYLLETMPCVILILCRYGHDPEEAIVRAVNDTKDNDTVAAIVGAAVGALHGRSALPKPWIDKLTGRTGESDDGRVFELLAEAQQLWW
ncbi:MAG: ADP-ribosylglycohydrolase family protein [Myxococcales bacterium]|nr:ADP-ribosylglycohydrolase family protein [Myxococcales bacterium]